MRHFAICVALLFIASSSAFAQQSVGFSNPDNIDSILDYRLPAWGYSNFYLDFDAQANGSDQKSTFSDNARRQGSFIVRPTYDLYRESEARIFRFNTGVDLTFLNGVDKSSNDFSSSDAKVQSQNFESNFDISTSLREYVTDRSFLVRRRAVPFYV
ncbi:MAG: hypothetical protein U5J63_03460 [Fodinibius sp.]|nr:hypothetical protein [Fodinibius sp.]